MPRAPKPRAPQPPPAFPTAALAFPDAPALAPEACELLSEAMAKGLPLKLACAQVGLDVRQVEAAARGDAELAARLASFRHRGIAFLVEKLIAKAEKGSETAIRFLLETSGDHNFIPRLQLQVSEDDILRSKAFQHFLNVDLPALLCDDCKSRIKEEQGS